MQQLDVGFQVNQAQRITGIKFEKRDLYLSDIAKIVERQSLQNILIRLRTMINGVAVCYCGCLIAYAAS